MIKKGLHFLVLSIISIQSFSRDVKTSTDKTTKCLNSNGVSFTENKGQVVDQNYHSRPDVLFSGQNKGLIFHLRNNGISYQLNRVDKWKEISDDEIKLNLNKSLVSNKKIIDKQTIYRVDINWLNSNNNSTVLKQNATEGFTNYYTEGCPEGGALNVRSYKEITYQNLYNGIDLKWYEKDGNLKYDYLCTTGSDYKQIQLQLNGAQNVSINNKGELIIKTPLGVITEKAPLVMQQAHELKSKWILKKTTELNYTVSFEIKNLNPNEPYVIDPAVRVWGSYYGGGDTDYGGSCSVDAFGNIYISGYTSSNVGNSIATSGAHQNIFGGGIYDAYLVKFNSTGARLWGTYYGGTGDDYGGCFVDGNGNIYMSGTTTTTVGTAVATSGSHQSSFGGGTSDAFLVKFNSSGIRQWGTYYGGAGNDYAGRCFVDASGNIYMPGNTTTTVGTAIATSGSHQGFGLNIDAFLVKFNTNGIRQWGTYYGGTGTEYAWGCTGDANGNIFLTGNSTSTSGTAIATSGSHQSSSGGPGADAFLVKFNTNGIRQWGTYYGGTGSDSGHDIVCDSNNNIYMSGSTTTTVGTSIGTAGSHQSSFGGGSADNFLVKFNTNGFRQWATYYGGSGGEGESSCAVDINDNIYLTGSTGSSLVNIISTMGSHQSSLAGGSDVFLVKFNSAGGRQWGTYYGGGANEDWSKCAVDATGNIYMTGSTTSNVGTAIATLGSHQSSYGGGTYDAFLVKFMDCDLLSPLASVNSNICEGASINFTASITGTATPTYSWSGPSSYSSSIQNPTIVGASAVNIGVYTLTINNAGCIETATTTVATVNTTPTVSVNSGSVCTGNSFTINPTGANTYTITGGSAIVSPTTNTSYNVTGTSAQGCVSSNTAISSVTVNAKPTIAVNSGSICSGNTFTISPSGANTYTISGGSSVVTPTSNISYNVTGTSAQGCVSSNTAVSSVIVNPLPNVTAITSNTLLCTGQTASLVASGAVTYTWSTNNNGSSVSVSPINTTTYTVTGADVNGCLNTAIITQSVSTCTNVNSQNTIEEADIILYPNPTNSVINIESNFEIITIKLFDSIGKELSVDFINNSIDVSELKKGLYYLNLTNENKQAFTQKIIIQ